MFFGVLFLLAITERHLPNNVKRRRRTKRWSNVESGTSKPACTWLFPSPETPSLTLGLEALDVAELRELTDSWLPLRSRRRPVLPMERDMRLVLGVAGTVVFWTLWIGANRPYRGWQSKYLQTDKDNANVSHYLRIIKVFFKSFYCKRHAI